MKLALIKSKISSLKSNLKFKLSLNLKLVIKPLYILTPLLLKSKENKALNIYKTNIIAFYIFTYNLKKY